MHHRCKNDKNACFNCILFREAAKKASNHFFFLVLPTLVMPLYTCPLCKSADNELIERIAVKDLNSLYEKSYQISIHRLYATPLIDLVACKQCSLQFYYPIVGGDEAFYNALQKKPWYYADDKAEYRYALTHIQPSDRVLEIGSGKGAFAKKLHVDHYIGLEFSKEAKEMAAKQGITIVNESIQEHALMHAAQYTVVCNFQVLEHVLDIFEFIEASVTCLAVGGKMIISVPSQDSFLQDVVNDTLNLPPHHISRWPNKTFEYIAKKFNLSLLSIKHQPLESNHYFLYTYSIATQAARRFLKKQRAYVDLGLMQQVSKIFGHVIGKFLCGTMQAHNVPKGHTVTVVFQKIS